MTVAPRSRRRHLAVRRWTTTWGRAIVIMVAFVLQIGLITGAVVFLAEWSGWIFGIQLVLGLGALLHILNSRMETTYKLAWAVPVLAAPVIGTAFYLVFGTKRGTQKQRARLEETAAAAQEAMSMVGGADSEAIIANDAMVRRQATYLETASHYRIYDETTTHYYPVGEEGFEAMLASVRRAQHYVFVEYFIVAHGRMLDRLVDALAERAAAGVEVRFLYDDFGSFFRLPVDFAKRCEKLNIKVLPVNPVGLGFTLTFQNRNHRKLLVVDGVEAFTGGINIGDEYINEKERFGHWKDSVIELRGSGAWPLAVMFLHMWALATREQVDYSQFVPQQQLPATTAPADAGWLAPFDDSPFDDVSFGLDMYSHMLNSASRSVDIFTPYLIVNDALLEQLRATAQSGIRVRIVTPHIPDKRYVHMVTRSYYRPLMEAGVEIYEYTPGFLHSKSMLVDDDLAIVGTINFDFRSFFLHQECAVWLYKTHPALDELREDVDETLAVSQRIDFDDLDDNNAFLRLVQSVLKAFAPLM